MPILPVIVAALVLGWLVKRNARPSPNFSWAEASVTSTGLPNTIPSAYRGNVRLVALEVLEPLRARIGPFSPTSWYRSPAVNAAVGGKLDSLHMSGLGVDIGAGTAGLSSAQLLAVVRSLDLRVPVDLLDEGDHLHIEAG